MMNQLTIENILAEHKAWTKHNFDFEAPALGLIEEVGEFAHQLLKSGQKIRVTSDPMRKDALADATIFFFHLCWKYGHFPHDHPTPLRRTTSWHIGALCQFAGKILCEIEEGERPSTIHLCGVWEQICNIAYLEGWDLEYIVTTTWTSVRVRDFRKFPGTGLPAEMV